MVKSITGWRAEKGEVTVFVKMIATEKELEDREIKEEIRGFINYMKEHLANRKGWGYSLNGFREVEFYYGRHFGYFSDVEDMRRWIEEKEKELDEVIAKWKELLHEYRRLRDITEEDKERFKEFFE
jgi:hypothetical protein